MIKKERYVATHLDTDSAPDKRDTTSYYAAYNLEVVNNGRLLSINPTKTKGVFDSGTDFGVLVGDVVIDKVLYLFEFKSGEPYPDSIYSVTTEAVIAKVVSSNYGWDADTQLDVVGNRENENIIKVYWADSVNQLRALNVVDAPYADGTIADIVLPVSLSKPTTETIQGGNLIAGKVQYAYSLFNLHGVESVISNLSQPLSISYDMVGGESGEVMPLSAEVTIDAIDTTFEYIRVYSIHYQEANQIPKITLIYETKIAGTSLTITDDGNLFISELSYEQFVFLGGVLIIPKTIASKDNRLFAANYKTTNFDIDNTIPLDCRVFGFGIAVIEHDQELWSNEIAQPLLPVEVINTPLINSPEDYAFAQNVHSLANVYTNREYAIISGGTAETTWALAGATLPGTSPVTDPITGSGGTGLYVVNIDFDVYKNGGTSVTASLIVETSLVGVVQEVITNSIGGVYSVTTHEDHDFEIILTLPFDSIKTTVTNSDTANFNVTGNSWGYKQVEWEALKSVPIADPGDVGVWEDYDISDVEHGGVNT